MEANPRANYRHAQIEFQYEKTRRCRELQTIVFAITIANLVIRFDVFIHWYQFNEEHSIDQMINKNKFTFKSLQ